MVWHLWKARQVQDGRKTKCFSIRHVVGIVLVGIHTGARSRRIRTASLEREEGLPWLDLDGDVFSMTRDEFLKVHGQEHRGADRDGGLAFNRRAGGQNKASSGVAVEIRLEEKPAGPERRAKYLKIGGRDRDRTCDPFGVNEVLSR